MNSKKFMKSLAIILSAANVLSAAAFAEAVQTGENSVKITGNIGKAEVCDYTIDVYAPGKTWADINKDFGATDTDVLVYHNQLETDKDGNYIKRLEGGKKTKNIDAGTTYLSAGSSVTQNLKSTFEISELESLYNSGGI